MKKIILFLVFVSMSLAYANIASARCPRFVDDLKQLQGCMLPVAGNTGTVYRGTAATINGNGPVHVPVRPYVAGTYYGAMSPMTHVAARYAGGGSNAYWALWAMRATSGRRWYW